MKEIDYKLNINKSKISKISNLKKKEESFLKFWKKNYFLFLKGKKNNKIIIHDGPPYANGKIHIGHCINKIFKDLIIKSRIFMNYNVSYVIGWDCHGLPIEINFNINKKNKIEILKNCRRYAKKQIKIQKKDFNKLGVFFNPKKNYKTMDYNLEYKEIKILYKFFEKGYIKKKKKSVHWCEICNSTISNYEFIEKLTRKQKTKIYIRVINEENNKKYKKKIKINLKKIFFIKKIFLREKILKNKKFYFNNFRGKKVYLNYKIKNKIFFYKNLKLNLCKFSKYFKKNILVKKSYIIIKKKICWRHKTILIRKKKHQFYIKIRKNLRKKLKNNLKKIEFLPKNSKNSIIKNIIKRPNWIISRQKIWGVPIAVFEKNNKPIFNKKTKLVYLKFLKKVKKNGIEEWNKEKYKKLSKKMGMEKNNDILDVWFDSGITHYTVLKNKKFKIGFPADIYLEGNDQHRGWFNSSLITSFLLNKSAPYKKLITHGFALDERGKKMSKSLGNSISPIEIIKNYNTDILRLYISSRNIYKDIKFSKKSLNLTKDIYIKIRNIIRFINNNIKDLKCYKKKSEINFVNVDKYFNHYLIKLEKQTKTLYKSFLFYKAFKKIENFCFKILSNFYFEIIKDRLYVLEKNSNNRKSAQLTLRNVLKFLLKNLSIFIPFCAEYNYLKNFKKKSIFLERNKNKIFSKIYIKKLKYIIKIKKDINKNFLKIKNFGKNIFESEVTIFFKKKKEYYFYKKIKNELKYLINSSKVQVVKGYIKGYKFIFKKKYKCERCWNYYSSIKKKICKRCYKIIFKLKIKERRYI